MTAHRAASPVTPEVSGPHHDGLPTAGRSEGLCTAPSVICTPSVAGGPGYVVPQPAASCAFSTRPESVKAARDFTRVTLLDWGMTELTDVAELVVSELLTNALRHGLRSARKPPGDYPIRLRLLAQAPFIMCMVTDPGSEIPVLHDFDPAAESGRGLTVVEACTVRWGWHLLDGDGKVVWALLR